MIISLSCCFWRCSLIIRNKLTWKHTRLVSLSAPMSIQTALFPPAAYNYPLLPGSPAQATPLPSCIRPFSVTIHYFDGSQRKKERETKRQKDGGYIDFQTWAPIFFFPIFLFPLLSFFLPLLTLSLLHLPLFNPFSCFFLLTVPSLYSEPPLSLTDFPTPPPTPLFLYFPFFFPSPSRPTLPTHPPLLLPLQPLYTPLTFWLCIASLLAAFRKPDKAYGKRGARV